MPTPPIEDLEEKIIDILRKHRPDGPGIQGCSNPLDVYDHVLHHELIAPLLKQAFDEGLVTPIDDKGHDTEFKGAWNRVIKGQGGTWDSRSIGDLFVNACLKDVPGLFDKIFSGQFDEIDQALISNLPELLSGGSSTPTGGWSTKSWVDGSHISLRFEGLQALPCNDDGGGLVAPEFFPPALNLSKLSTYNLEKPATLQAIMSFHSGEIDYDEGQKAWQAWADAADRAGLLKHGFYDSMLGMISRNILSADKIGVTFQSLRQDEAVSFEVTPEGVQIFLGEVEGLEIIRDEGQLMIGKEEAWVEILTAGGFTKEEALDYLDRLSTTSGSFRVNLPAGSNMRMMLDPETLLAEHMDPYDVIYNLPRDQAISICAAGTFEMPLMTTHRERAANERHLDNDQGAPSP